MVDLGDMNWPLPRWAAGLLVCPSCGGAITVDGEALFCLYCGEVGRWENGIVRLCASGDDPSISWYAGKGGVQFMERTKIPFTMTSLETPVYHSYLRGAAPADKDCLIVDVGAGDGRNSEPWLQWGYKRIIALDPVAASLQRFKARIDATHPAWRERLLLVEADARTMPLVTGCAGFVQAIETLYYLNEDYEKGLAECGRILRRGGTLVLSERTLEGALMTRLLYGGVAEMLHVKRTGYLLDGSTEPLVRSRTFTEEELLVVVRRGGFFPVDCKGLPLLSVVLGYLRGQGKISQEEEKFMPKVVELLESLRDTGKAQRTLLVRAEKQ